MLGFTKQKHVNAFICMAFSRYFNPSDLQRVDLPEEGETIYRCRYDKDVDRTKCKTLTISRLTHSPYITKITYNKCVAGENKQIGRTS